MRAWPFTIAAAVLLCGCPSTAPGETACLSNRDCPDDTVCIIGRCSSLDAGALRDTGTVDTGHVDTGPDAGALIDTGSDASMVDAGPVDAGPCRSEDDCAPGSACCDGACVDLQNDSAQCGACGFVCGPNATCVAGSCTCADASHDDCDGDLSVSGNDGCEVDLRTDPENCSACRNSCSDQNVSVGSCVGSACVVGTCDALFEDCNGTAADGCETNLSLVSTCGSCATACTPLNADPRCVVAGREASCGYGTCSGAFGNCDGSTVNGCETSLRATSTCGSCTSNCTALVTHATGASCSAAGTCDYASCSGGFSDCDGNRSNGCEGAWSATRCGPTCRNCSATVVNATGALCTAAGTCDYGACNAGFGDCDGIRSNGCEVSLTSATRCGSCTNDCTDQNVLTGSCTMGSCTITACVAGRGNCDGTTANGCEATTAGTPSGCCGAVCTAPIVCDPGPNGSFMCR